MAHTIEAPHTFLIQVLQQRGVHKIQVRWNDNQRKAGKQEVHLQDGPARQTGRQADGQTDRQTDRHGRCAYLYCLCITQKSLTCTEAGFVHTRSTPTSHQTSPCPLEQGLTSMPSNSILITGTNASGTNCGCHVQCTYVQQNAQSCHHTHIHTTHLLHMRTAVHRQVLR